MDWILDLGKPQNTPMACFVVFGCKGVSWLLAPLNYDVKSRRDRIALREVIFLGVLDNSKYPENLCVCKGLLKQRAHKIGLLAGDYQRKGSDPGRLSCSS